MLVLLRTFLLGATGLVSETRPNTSAHTICQLWGTGNQTPRWRQSSPSPAGRAVQPQSNPSPRVLHLPGAGFSSGAAPALTGTVTPEDGGYKAIRLLPSRVTRSVQPCCSSGAAGRLKGGDCCRSWGAEQSPQPILWFWDTDLFLTAPR